MAIAVSDELQEKGTQGLHSRVCQVGVLPASHRASRYALQARRMAIAVPDDICRKRGQRTITICGNGENRCTGGLAPIIEVRISGPPGSGTLRGVDTDIWRKDIRTVTRPMWWKRNGALQSHRGP